ncbi:MAG: PQQ-dependent sugar dehydrogenase [Longimicrobiales bacterium]
MSLPAHRSLLALLTAVAVGCAPQGDAPADGSTASGAATGSPLAERCAPDNGGLTLPDGFCAWIAVDSLPGARHVEVASNGDVLVALRDTRTTRDGPVRTGGVAVLRDADGNGILDAAGRFGETGGNDVVLHGGYLYFAPDDRVLRWPFPEGATEPAGAAEVLVTGLPATQNHTAKSIAVSGDDLFVNIGSPSNACMQQSRTVGSPGQDPCPELDTRAGIWRFSASTPGQTQADGSRYATGLRNVVALRLHPGQDQLYGVVHGRDQLHGMWPERYTVEQNAENPSEEFVRITEGSDFGWPYCYHDPETGEKLLAPEYGGDGTEVGRCADADMPLVGFPAHWAPNDLEFYTGSQFPERYRGGAFVAFHGSWNRAPLPQAGYQVAFVPAAGASFGPEWETFADGFRAEGADDTARPVGLAVGPDGSLYVTDSVRGRIWRIVYAGS